MSRESTQLIELVEAPKPEGNRAVLTYKRLDGAADGKTLTCNKFISNLTDVEKELLKTTWTADKKLTIVKEEVSYTGKDGSSRTAWNLKEIKPASAFVPKETKGDYKKGNRGGGYDNVGMQIGNAINNAVVLEGQGATNEDILNRARAIIKMGNTLREEYESLAATTQNNTPLAENKESLYNLRFKPTVQENKEAHFDDFESLEDQDFF